LILRVCIVLYVGLGFASTSFSVDFQQKATPQDNTDTVRSEDPVCRMIQYGHTQTAKSCMQSGAYKIDSKDRLGRRPLYLAIAYAYTELLDILLEHGVTVEQEDIVACVLQHTSCAVMRRLIQYTTSSKSTADALSKLAILRDDSKLAMMCLVLQSGCQVDAYTSCIGTPLHCVSHFLGRQSTTSAISDHQAFMLLSFGSDATAYNEDNETPVNILRRTVSADAMLQGNTINYFTLWALMQPDGITGILQRIANGETFNTRYSNTALMQLMLGQNVCDGLPPRKHMNVRPYIYDNASIKERAQSMIHGMVLWTLGRNNRYKGDAFIGYVQNDVSLSTIHEVLDGSTPEEWQAYNAYKDYSFRRSLWGMLQGTRDTTAITRNTTTSPSQSVFTDIDIHVSSQSLCERDEHMKKLVGSKRKRFSSADCE